jgi:broad specificity phosphatase PhoE
VLISGSAISEKNIVMKTMQELLSEIMLLTNHIETEYPELYRFLDENPMTIPSLDHPNIDKEIMKEYMDSLKQLLEHYLETHQTNKILGKSHS